MSNSKKLKLFYLQILFIITIKLYTVSTVESVSMAFKENNNRPSTVKDLSKRVSNKMSFINSISFSFTQTTFIAETTQTVKADVYFKKPDKVKIKYYEPEKQEICINEGYLYTYIPKIKQATRQKTGNIDELLGVTTSVILSTDTFGILKKGYLLKLISDKDTVYSAMLEARPRYVKNFDRIIIYFKESSYLPGKAVVTADNFMSETVFSDYNINPVFEGEMFSLNSGKNIKVINIE